MVSFEQLERIAREMGYDSVDVVRFKHKDRIVLQRKGITIRLFLKTKIENLTEKELRKMLQW